ncbi:MAG: hypothetical protein M0Z42_00275 [Actinomycetota bacterium]|nr:hypothetical protein [Actinomycetota bacterium]
MGRLDRQVRWLAAQVARQPGWWPVATYADRWPSVRTDRRGLVRLLADAGFGAFDLVAMDGLARLAPDRVTARRFGHGSRASVCRWWICAHRASDGSPPWWPTSPSPT